MLVFLKYLDDRLSEASTWASISTSLLALHVNVDSTLWASISLYGMVCAGALAVFLKETGTKPPSTIAADVLSALSSGLKLTSQNTPKEN